MHGDPEERFASSGGVASGVATLVLLAAAFALGLREGWGLAAHGVLLVLAVLAWGALLRPRVSIDGDRLRLRGVLSTTVIPLAAVQEVLVRQVLAVRVGERTFTSPAVGRRVKRAMGYHEPVSADGAMLGLAASPEAELAQSRIRDAALAARKRAGLEEWSPEQLALGEQVQREAAWLELGLLVVGVGLVVVGLLLG
ncbi:hypothetical protein [Nocardioides nanhaiensis]|uniref:PH domain-containing protein n=1 Tax=Nocardioides nanhaiensis TaxID=1476871 RepID=A0ABP8VZ47_9ACTN